MSDETSKLKLRIQALEFALADWLICADTPAEWMRCRDAAKNILNGYENACTRVEKKTVGEE